MPSAGGASPDPPRTEHRSCPTADFNLPTSPPVSCSSVSHRGLQDQMLYLFMSFTGCVLSRTPAPQGRGFGRCPSFFTAEASVPGTWQVNPGAGRGDEQPCEAGSLREPPSGTGSGGLGSDAIPGQLWGARQGPRENVPVAELSGHGGQAGPGSGSQAWGWLRWHRGPSGSGLWPEHAARSDCPN